MAAADPYSSIKDELDAELQIINGLQAKLFAGHPEAAPQLRSHLSNVQEQLRALEAAVKLMVDHPARFQLDSTTAFMRQVEVEGLRFQYEQLQATVSAVTTVSVHHSQQQQQQQQQQQWREVEMHGGMTGVNGSAQQQPSSTRLPPPPIRHSKLVQQQQQQQQQQQHSGAAGAAAAKHAKHGSNASSTGGWSDFTPPGTAGAAAAGDSSRDDDTQRPWDTFSYETAMQQQMLQQQDQELGHISVHVDRIKQQGLAMNEELEQQSLLLGGLEDHTDTTTQRLRGLRSKVNDVIKRSRHDKQLCTILFLSALLVVLTLIALA
ncbi:hypothetical protein OEZ85_001579 [Tetradesmus obliquus]|uniref:t-SNARE coiled-coil homology domain-containing protein n=1 Tax=Tetradesmus obliquus TaxID=3088 RepID=A0ABY8U096_TETOB|nr:hypothetical protein OEZ85_001579 [Tetradesmus obliquus]